MAEEKEGTVIVSGYEIVNGDKYQRAVFGSVGKEGKLYGGVGEKATDEEKIAAYDKIGGLILKNGRRVKTGSFFDFKKKAIREKPEVILLFKDLEGNTAEIREDEEIPLELKAAERIQEKKLEKTKEEHKKRGRPKKEDDDE